jgi:hypothetical protein
MGIWGGGDRHSSVYNKEELVSQKVGRFLTLYRKCQFGVMGEVFFQLHSDPSSTLLLRKSLHDELLPVRP